MNTHVLLGPGVMQWGPGTCPPAGPVLQVSTVTSQPSLSPLGFVLQVYIFMMDISSNAMGHDFIASSEYFRGLKYRTDVYF
jgi:hypothetical protein